MLRIDTWIRGSGRAKALLAGALVAFVLLFALAGALTPGPPRRGTPVVILSPHWEGIIKEFGRGFADWLKEKHDTEAYVEHLDVGGGTGTIVSYIESSFRATPDGIGVDVIFGGGPAAHASLARKRLLARTKLPGYVEAGLARRIGGMDLRDPLGCWHGAAMSGFGIVWNKRIVERMGLPRVADWEDLTNPNLSGWVASGDPTSSGSVLAVFETILQAYGFEKGYAVVTQIAANVAAFDVGGNSAARSVGLGQSAYGLSIDIYAYEQIARAGEENVGFVLPEKHTVITPDPVAVLKGAPHPKLARRFIEYVLSEEGQKLWYVKVGEEGGPKRFGLNRLPVRRSLYDSGLPTGVAVNPFTWGGGGSYDAELARQRRGVFADLVRSTLIDAHSELRECWSALIAAGEPQDLTARFCASPAANEELLKLSRTWRDDAHLRQDTMARWSLFARRKYRDVRAEAEERAARTDLERLPGR